MLRRSGPAVGFPFRLRLPYYPDREPISSPRLVKPSVTMSRADFSFLLLVKHYGTYRATLTLACGRRTPRPLNSRTSPYSHCLCHTCQPRISRFPTQLTLY